MFLQRKYKLLYLLFLPAVLMTLTGCYDMTVQLVSVPANTPQTEPIYISGNFNNWDPGDPNYVLTRNNDSVLEVKLPRGIGEIEYKFTRGDWSTVEKDICGFEISNRNAFYGRQETLQDTIMSWNDLPKPACPSVNLIIESLPENTPDDAVLYLAADFNGWDPGSRYWMFTRDLDGKYYIEVPRARAYDMEFKITRGNWRTVETDAFGQDIDNRRLLKGPGNEIKINIEGWKDR